jgi:hypothetical protein
MTSSIETFEQANQLDTAALRALLAGDRPEQRVWAMWALALRHQGAMDMIHRTALEPDPGVRRTAVMLASHGETDLLVALARHDPALLVRASAMQLVTRLAAGGLIDRAVVLEAAQREPEIQASILAGIEARAPEFLLQIATHVLHCGAAALRLEAFEALIRIGTPASLDIATAWLGSCPFTATEACHRWAQIGSPEAVSRALARASFDVRRGAVQALGGVSWSVVEALVGGDRTLMLCAVAAGVEVPVDLLAQLVLDDPSRRARAALTRRLRTLATPPAELVPFLPRLHDHGERCIERLQAEDDVALEELRAWRRRRQAALSARVAADLAIAARLQNAERHHNARRDLALLLREVERLSGGERHAPG